MKEHKEKIISLIAVLVIVIIAIITGGLVFKEIQDALSMPKTEIFEIKSVFQNQTFKTKYTIFKILNVSLYDESTRNWTEINLSFVKYDDKYFRGNHFTVDKLAFENNSNFTKIKVVYLISVDMIA